MEQNNIIIAAIQKIKFKPNVKLQAANLTVPRRDRERDRGDKLAESTSGEPDITLIIVYIYYLAPTTSLSAGYHADKLVTG